MEVLSLLKELRPPHAMWYGPKKFFLIKEKKRFPSLGKRVGESPKNPQKYHEKKKKSYPFVRPSP